MKTIKIILTVLTLPLLISFSIAQNGGLNNKNGSIKKTIYDYKGFDEVKNFIDTLKLGDQKLIKNMSAENGYKSLINYACPTHNLPEKCLNQLYEELSVAEFNPGVSNEMIDYYYFNFDNKRKYELGFVSLATGYKLVIFKRERNLSNKTDEIKWGQ